MAHLLKGTVTIETAPGLRHSPAFYTPSFAVWWVDAGGSDSLGDGSSTNPYQTIQHALDQIPFSADAATARRVNIVKVKAGTYDEDLAVDITNRRIVLETLGAVNIGSFNDPSFWGPTAPWRNITVTCTAPDLYSIRCGFGIVASTASNPSTHEAYIYGARLSGQILMSSPVFATAEIHLEGVNVFGNPGAVSFVCTGWGGTVNAYFDICRMVGAVQGAGKLHLNAARRCQFGAAVAVNNFSLISESNVGSGLTVSADGPDVFPAGIVNSYFAGAFSGPAASLRLDAFTDYWFVANGATLAGAATKRFLTTSPVSVAATAQAGAASPVVASLDGSQAAGSMCRACCYATAVGNAGNITFAAAYTDVEGAKTQSSVTPVAPGTCAGAAFVLRLASGNVQVTATSSGGGNLSLYCTLERIR